jgi:glycerol-3-phosphate responsive antiterminator
MKSKRMSQILTEEKRESVFLIRESAFNTNHAFDFLCKFNNNVHAHVSRLQGLIAKMEICTFLTQNIQNDLVITYILMMMHGHLLLI